MPQTTTVLKRLALSAALVGVLPTATGADEVLRAEVQHALATPDSSEDPDVAIYKLQFDLRLTNRSAKPINIPRLETHGNDTTRFEVLDVQSKRPGEDWTNVIQSSWYGLGTEKYDPCTLLSPAATAEIEGVASGLILLTKQLTSLGSEPTIRLHLMIFCRQPDGKVITTAVPTEAFSLRLPAHP